MSFQQFHERDHAVLSTVFIYSFS